MKTYAYVTTETCRVMDAAKPGSFIGHDEIPVAKHGDYTPWVAGKKETLKKASIGDTPYMRAAARAVAHLMGWV